MNVKIINKIEEKMNEYQERSGCTKLWLAKQIGISRQQMYSLINADNMTVEMLAKFAILFNCKLEDLIEYIRVEDVEK